MTYNKNLTFLCAISSCLILLFLLIAMFSMYRQKHDITSTSCRLKAETDIHDTTLHTYEDYKNATKKALLDMDYIYVDQLLSAMEEYFSSDEKYEEFANIFSRIYVSIMLGNNIMAISGAESLAQKHPSCFSHVILFSVYTRYNKFTEAMKVVEKMESSYPNKLQASFFRIVLLFSQNMIDEGIREYEKIDIQLKRDPFLFDMVFKNSYYDELEQTLGKIKNKPNEYSLIISNELPPHPKKSKDDPEKIDITINVFFDIVSKLDGKTVYTGSIGF